VIHVQAKYDATPLARTSESRGPCTYDFRRWYSVDGSGGRRSMLDVFWAHSTWKQLSMLTGVDDQFLAWSDEESDCCYC
jgi:hypothetical protein